MTRATAVEMRSSSFPLEVSCGPVGCFFASGLDEVVYETCRGPSALPSPQACDATGDAVCWAVSDPTRCGLQREFASWSLTCLQNVAPCHHAP